MNKNVKLAVFLAVLASSVGVSVFWWRLGHNLPPMPQGSVYGNAYVPLNTGQEMPVPMAVSADTVTNTLSPAPVTTPE
jgi:hypothetical protein